MMPRTFQWALSRVGKSWTPNEHGARYRKCVEDPARGGNGNISGFVSNRQSIWRDSDVLLADVGLHAIGSQPDGNANKFLRLRNSGHIHVLWSLRSEFLWDLAAGIEDRRGLDRGEHSVGHGHGRRSPNGC